MVVASWSSTIFTDERGIASASFSSRQRFFPERRLYRLSLRAIPTVTRIRALVVDPSESSHGSVDDFVARMEKTWLISKQPRPVKCVSCQAAGVVDCQWCRGTGFFILGDNILCEVPSRNTTCLICLGKCAVSCKDCKGTGYVARWLCDPISKNRAS
ncbi:hypothetical protein KP509_23G034900 [Ceratopteris richardii]|nr:hypothetical protein KP509_23G034900 [Ceratopteris richardii]